MRGAITPSLLMFEAFSVPSSEQWAKHSLAREVLEITGPICESPCCPGAWLMEPGPQWISVSTYSVGTDALSLLEWTCKVLVVWAAHSLMMLAVHLWERAALGWRSPWRPRRPSEAGVEADAPPSSPTWGGH